MFLFVFKSAFSVGSCREIHRLLWRWTPVGNLDGVPQRWGTFPAHIKLRLSTNGSQMSGFCTSNPPCSWIHSRKEHHSFRPEASEHCSRGEDPETFNRQPIQQSWKWQSNLQGCRNQHRKPFRFIPKFRNDTAMWKVEDHRLRVSPRPRNRWSDQHQYVWNVGVHGTGSDEMWPRLLRIRHVVHWSHSLHDGLRRAVSILGRQRISNAAYDSPRYNR